MTLLCMYVLQYLVLDLEFVLNTWYMTHVLLTTVVVLSANCYASQTTLDRDWGDCQIHI